MTANPRLTLVLREDLEADPTDAGPEGDASARTTPSGKEAPFTSARAVYVAPAGRDVALPPVAASEFAQWGFRELRAHHEQVAARIRDADAMARATQALAAAWPPRHGETAASFHERFLILLLAGPLPSRALRIEPTDGFAAACATFDEAVTRASAWVEEGECSLVLVVQVDDVAAAAAEAWMQAFAEHRAARTLDFEPFEPVAPPGHRGFGGMGR